MNRSVARQMIAADILKLRRHRSTMATAAALSVGITILYLAVTLTRHGGQLPGTMTLSNGTSLMGLYFGSFAAILIGTEAGTIDLAGGVFGDLAATGRSRKALFFARIPAAIAGALVFTLSGFIVAVAAAFAFHGNRPAPSVGLTLESATWVVLATVAVTSLAVGVGSFTGSRAVTLVAIIGWQAIATGLIYAASFLGTARALALMISVCHFLPGEEVGSRAHPGATNALVNYKLAMPGALAALVILAWLVAAAAAGACRTRTRG